MVLVAQFEWLPQQVQGGAASLCVTHPCVFEMSLCLASPVPDDGSGGSVHMAVLHQVHGGAATLCVFMAGCIHVCLCMSRCLVRGRWFWKHSTHGCAEGRCNPPRAWLSCFRVWQLSMMCLCHMELCSWSVCVCLLTAMFGRRCL